MYGRTTVNIKHCKVNVRYISELNLNNVIQEKKNTLTVSGSLITRFANNIMMKEWYTSSENDKLLIYLQPD